MDIVDLSSRQKLTTSSLTFYKVHGGERFDPESEKSLMDFFRRIGQLPTSATTMILMKRKTSEYFVFYSESTNQNTLEYRRIIPTELRTKGASPQPDVISLVCVRLILRSEICHASLVI